MKVLIISPHFPPINGADMHRIRQSLPYYRDWDWETTVAAVEPSYVEGSRDALLEQSIPADTRIIRIKAFDTKWTRKFGLGSLALRSLWFYWKTVNRLLRREHFDLIFFSTTQFPLLILGNYWKKRFGIPYVIDMQDPWYNDYYETHPWVKRPPKYWFASRLNKYLEPIAMRHVSALIAVSDAYNKTLRERYPHIQSGQCHTITFGAAERDFQIVQASGVQQQIFSPSPDHVNIVYAGIANSSMQQALQILMGSLKSGLARWPEVFRAVRLHFIGTTYAPNGKAESAIEPIAQEAGISSYVQEYPERLPYFQTLRLLLDADILLIIGSDDPNYTASKLYPYILARKPLLAIFHENSSILRAIKEINAGYCIPFGVPGKEAELAAQTASILHDWILKLPFAPPLNWSFVEPHLAATKTAEQVRVFNQAIKADA